MDGLDPRRSVATLPGSDSAPSGSPPSVPSRLGGRTMLGGPRGMDRGAGDSREGRGVGRTGGRRNARETPEISSPTRIHSSGAAALLSEAVGRERQRRVMDVGR